LRREHASRADPPTISNLDVHCRADREVISKLELASGSVFEAFLHFGKSSAAASSVTSNLETQREQTCDPPSNAKRREGLLGIVFQFRKGLRVSFLALFQIGKDVRVSPAAEF
jgi:hypothetical protein